MSGDVSVSDDGVVGGSGTPHEAAGARADEDGGLVDGVDASVLGADPRALLVLLGSSLTRLRSAEMRPTRERHALQLVPARSKARRTTQPMRKKPRQPDLGVRETICFTIHIVAAPRT